MCVGVVVVDLVVVVVVAVLALRMKCVYWCSNVAYVLEHLRKNISEWVKNWNFNLFGMFLKYNWGVYCDNFKTCNIN